MVVRSLRLLARSSLVPRSFYRIGSVRPPCRWTGVWDEDRIPSFFFSLAVGSRFSFINSSSFSLWLFTILHRRSTSGKRSTWTDCLKTIELRLVTQKPRPLICPFADSRRSNKSSICMECSNSIVSWLRAKSVTQKQRSPKSDSLRCEFILRDCDSARARTALCRFCNYRFVMCYTFE